jgi:hypothetical protein
MEKAARCGFEMGRSSMESRPSSHAHEREIERVASMTRAGQFKPEMREQMEKFELFARVDDEESGRRRRV